ncbi:MAG: carboxymethylenebutenolidase [Solirubrobacteraceae bacterium]|nr:carboxymethylenebutenolidase [Solirubrobacteraceae bacterium]MEA2356061.1 carboxymethylenebutenolidase [Solirubrobacteraceae bacterium]
MPLVEFEAAATPASGYLAVPASGGGPAVVVLQEWWGVDDHIRGVCDRLAGAGFIALAPDLYHGETTDQPDEAQQKMMALSMKRAEQEMAGAVALLAAHEGRTGTGVGAIGWCLGGGLAIWAAATNPEIRATVSFYYVMPHAKPDFSAIAGPVLGHFGTKDDFVPVEAAEGLLEELRAAGVDAEFVFHDGSGHAFFNDTNRLGTYDPDAAERAWERTVEFLRENLK